MGYGYAKVVESGVDDAIEKVTGELSEEGFGILTRIDVKDTLAKKLGEEIRPYVILGACNPQIAHRAMSVETELGLLLPCNVIVYENDEGKTVVSAIDAAKMLSVVDNPELGDAAEQVNAKLRAAIDRL